MSTRCYTDICVGIHVDVYVDIIICAVEDNKNEDPFFTIL